jgi:hypothetical protein
LSSGNLPTIIGHLAGGVNMDGSIASLKPADVSVDEFQRLVMSDEVPDGVALCAVIHDGLRMDFVRLEVAREI